MFALTHHLSNERTGILQVRAQLYHDRVKCEDLCELLDTSELNIPAHGISGFLGSSRGHAERNCHSIEGVHQSDRICQISEFLIAEFGSSGFVVSIGNAGFGYACDGFRPGERGALAGTEDFTRFVPHWDQHELVYRHAELEQIAGMHIDAICAAIDLRTPQIHKIDEFFWKAAV